MLDDLKGMPRWFWWIAGAVAVAGVLVYLRSRSGGTTAQVAPTTGTGRIVDYAAEFREATSGFAEQVEALKTTQESGFNAVASLIGTTAAQQANAYSAQNTAVIQALSDLTGAIQTALQSAVAAIVARVEPLTAGMAEVKTAVSGYGARFDALDKNRRLAFLAVGSQSVAACITPTGDPDATCVKSHAIDLPNAGYSSSQVPQLVRSLYPQCWTGALPDLACIGEKIAAARGGWTG